MGIYTLPIRYFPAILHKKATAGISLAVAFSLSCRKTSHFGVLRSFEERIFPPRESRGSRNTLCISRTRDFSVRKKIPSKPCKSLCEAALLPLSFLVYPSITSKSIIVANPSTIPIVAV